LGGPPIIDEAGYWGTALLGWVKFAAERTPQKREGTLQRATTALPGGRTTSGIARTTYKKKQRTWRANKKILDVLLRKNICARAKREDAIIEKGNLKRGSSGGREARGKDQPHTSTKKKEKGNVPINRE